VANLIVILIIVAAALLIGLFMSVRIVKQYEDGVLFPLGRVGGERASPAA
jgi:regulator of protease activity HflC (stomatin/prohibitin superfamily)